uniref:Uncharacterized protein n=1 Tax=Chromera velia CCMP2878 TaxID=1169474 RepID=A0A0G4H917_9ALVE|eukprot:Cvel_5931.t1-p1 / transcript=Cvel_5931.t1 / gene=Cvel_5931 / organism=Chromera_velia_CCMP2878 / gene_product=hypothetical protein / transcript_product=hypothetical protein / location=Cvel_scaffold283:91921-93864(-) / protein_length=648 / sequence_SO=supercontig / SO=protein_coding / is_pseudo=false
MTDETGSRLYFPVLGVKDSFEGFKLDCTAICKGDPAFKKLSKDEQLSKVATALFRSAKGHPDCGEQVISLFKKVDAPEFSNGNTSAPDTNWDKFCTTMWETIRIPLEKKDREKKEAVKAEYTEFSKSLVFDRISKWTVKWRLIEQKAAEVGVMITDEDKATHLLKSISRHSPSLHAILKVTMDAADQEDPKKILDKLKGLQETQEGDSWSLVGDALGGGGGSALPTQTAAKGPKVKEEFAGLVSVMQQTVQEQLRLAGFVGPGNVPARSSNGKGGKGQSRGRNQSGRGGSSGAGGAQRGPPNHGRGSCDACPRCARPGGHDAGFPCPALGRTCGYKPCGRKGHDAVACRMRKRDEENKQPGKSGPRGPQGYAGQVGGGKESSEQGIRVRDRITVTDMAFLSVGACTGQTKRPSPPIDKFVADTGATDNIGSTRVFGRYVIAHKPSTRDFRQAHGDAPAVQTEMECIVALPVTLLEGEPDNWQQRTDEPLVIRMWLSEDDSAHSFLSPEVINNDKADAVNSHCVFEDIWGRRKKVKIDYPRGDDKFAVPMVQLHPERFQHLELGGAHRLAAAVSASRHSQRLKEADEETCMTWHRRLMHQGKERLEETLKEEGLRMSHAAWQKVYADCRVCERRNAIFPSLHAVPDRRS